MKWLEIDEPMKKFTQVSSQKKSFSFFWIESLKQNQEFAMILSDCIWILKEISFCEDMNEFWLSIFSIANCIIDDKKNQLFELKYFTSGFHNFDIWVCFPH